MARLTPRPIPAIAHTGCSGIATRVPRLTPRWVWNRETGAHERYRRRGSDTISDVESGIGKDIAILVVGSAIGVVPWLLEQGGITMPRISIVIGGWFTIAALSWGLAKLLSIVEPESLRRFTVSGSGIPILCLAVFSATWWGLRIYPPAWPDHVRSTVREDAPREVESRTQRPELKLSISGGNVFLPDAPDLHNKVTGIALNAKVWNTGGPSVATEWNLFIIPQGATPLRAQLTKIPEHLKVGGAFNSLVIYASDALDAKTSQTQISSMPIEGVLLFYLPIPKVVIQAPSTRWELSVKDIYGNETRFNQLVGDWLTR